MNLSKIDDTTLTRCPTCNGQGTSKDRDLESGFPLACTDCRGTGHISVPTRLNRSRLN